MLKPSRPVPPVIESIAQAEESIENMRQHVAQLSPTIPHYEEFKAGYESQIALMEESLLLIRDHEKSQAKLRRQALAPLMFVALAAGCTVLFIVRDYF